MVKSFVEYMQESEELLEAVHPEMHEVFTRSEIQELGNKLSKLGLSLQDSEVQPWGPKGFKLKHAKEHHLHIVKVKGSRGYVILYYVNARSADIIDNTTGHEFSNFKEVYEKAEKIFSFNTAVDTKRLRIQRADNKFIYNDPLLRNKRVRDKHLQTFIDKRLEELRAKKVKKSYADEVMQELKRYGIGIKGLRVEEGVFYVDEMRVANLSRYITKEIIQVGLQERPTLKVTVSTKGFTGSTDIRRLINELEDALKAAEALDSIDRTKLNQN